MLRPQSAPFQGALSRLGAWVASDDRAVLQLKYRQYSAADVAAFFASYCKSSAGWVQHDYGKPDLPVFEAWARFGGVSFCGSCARCDYSR